MQQEAQPWTPTVGSRVRIKDSQLSGTVLKMKGVYEVRFRLQVPATTEDGSKPSTGQARAARIASRWYGLDELEPAPQA